MFMKICWQNLIKIKNHFHNRKLKSYLKAKQGLIDFVRSDVPLPNEQTAYTLEGVITDKW